MSVFEFNRKKLHHLAEEAGFGSENDMTGAERLLLKCVALGAWGDCDRDRLDEEQKIIRSKLFEWLLICPTLRTLLHPKGVQIIGATFEQELDLEDAWIDVPLWLYDCTFKCDIILRRARTRTLALQRCKIQSFAADGINVKGSVLLSEAEAEGEVRLVGAKIGGSLTCNGSKFRHAGNKALAADRIEVIGSVFLRRDFEAQGCVSLNNSRIKGALHVYDSSLRNEKGGGQLEAVALDLRGAVIEGLLWFVDPEEHSLPTKITGRVMLRHASVGQLIDSPEVWKPTDGRGPVPAALDGFTYDSLGLADGAIEVDFRKEWLERGIECSDTFAPQPYTQLAKVFREAGYEDRAKKILIARGWQRLDRMRGKLGFWNPKLSWLHGMLLGFGYRIRVPLLGLIVLAALGTWRFNIGWQDEQFNPAVPFIYNSFKKTGGWGVSVGEEQRWPHPYNEKFAEELKEYPKFQPFIYSLDTLLPIVNLHQEDFWMPTGYYRWYMWFHIGAGWFFTTMAVVGFTGLVRKE